jgi:hypothetical protein
VFLIALICTASRQILARASTDQETEKGDLVLDTVWCPRVGSNLLLQVLDLYWRGPKSGDLWCKSRRLKTAVWFSAGARRLSSRLPTQLSKWSKSCILRIGFQAD